MPVTQLVLVEKVVSKFPAQAVCLVVNCVIVERLGDEFFEVSDFNLVLASPLLASDVTSFL